MENKTTRIERKAKKFKNNWKLKLLAVLMGIGLAVYTIYACFIVIAEWFDNHKIVRQQAIKIQAPFIIKKREVKILTPLAKQVIEKPLVENQAYLENIYEQTRLYESGRGTNGTYDSTHGYCSRQSLVNEIGYFPDGNRKFCFESYTDQRETFTKWLTKRLKAGYTLKEAICFYVHGGPKQPTCKRALEMGL